MNQVREYFIQLSFALVLIHMSLVVSCVCARKPKIQKGIIKNNLKDLLCGSMSKQVEKDKNWS